MRRIRYQVASSLDGYIAGPNGEFDWIVMDPDIDFGALFAQFDTLLMGRKTFEGIPQGGGVGDGMKVVVFSRTLRAESQPGVTVVANGLAEFCEELKRQPGKDIWLFGGGELFASLLEAGQVDTVEIAVVPVLLGGGRPLLASPAVRQSLRLTRHRVYERSGIVLLEYEVVAVAAKSKRRRKAAEGNVG
jgi:dihydrofolate reductase